MRGRVGRRSCWGLRWLERSAGRRGLRPRRLRVPSRSGPPGGTLLLVPATVSQELKHAGVRTAALVLLGLGGLMTFHAMIGPPALVCLSAAAYMIERHGAREPAFRTGALGLRA